MSQARIVWLDARADRDEQMQAGEILVAPFTDPGWTPYFVPAAGIVTDQGGLLSRVLGTAVHTLFEELSRLRAAGAHGREPKAVFCSGAL